MSASKQGLKKDATIASDERQLAKLHSRINRKWCATYIKNCCTGNMTDEQLMAQKHCTVKMVETGCTITFKIPSLKVLTFNCDIEMSGGQ